MPTLREWRNDFSVEHPYRWFVVYVVAPSHFYPVPKLLSAEGKAWSQQVRTQ